MKEILPFALLSFTSFFTLINPLGTMPIFMTMTSGLEHKNRVKTARKAVIVAFITIVIFALSGQLLFNVFGISVNYFAMSGFGLLVLVLIFGFINTKCPSCKKFIGFKIKNYCPNCGLKFKGN